MADREKVIKALKLAASLVWNSNEGQCEIMDSDDALTVAHAIRDALELLKDQEPVKPIEQGDDSYVCDNCGEAVGWDEMECYGIGKIRCKYCPGCGRMVKWNG